MSAKRLTGLQLVVLRKLYAKGPGWHLRREFARSDQDYIIRRLVKLGLIEGRDSRAGYRSPKEYQLTEAGGVPLYAPR